MSIGLLITLTIIAIVVLVLWRLGKSFAKMLTRMENESEDAYWRLEDAKKIIDEAEIEEPKSNSSN